MIKFVAIFVCLILAGCSTKSPYVNSLASDLACVKSSPRTHFTTDRTLHIVINTIDEVKTGGDVGDEYCFAPGKHRLNIRAIGDSGSATGAFDFEFLPAKKYMLQGEEHGISEVLQLIEISVAPSFEVARFKIKMDSDVNNRGGGLGAYIFIPIK